MCPVGVISSAWEMYMVQMDTKKFLFTLKVFFLFHIESYIDYVGQVAGVFIYLFSHDITQHPEQHDIML